MQNSNASVTIVSGDLSTHPKCAHGPMILFSRRVGTHSKTYYACSACRDRKDCTGYMKSEDWNPNRSVLKEKCLSGNLGSSNQESNSILRILACAPEDRGFCRTCSKLLTNKDKTDHPENHQIRWGVANSDLTHPSQLLPALDNARKEAQYHFTEQSVEVIVSLLKAAKIENVISIGAPRIHERILNEEPGMRSVLLDFDRRYEQFFPEFLFCHYNMFNDHFFNGSNSETVFNEFLADDEPKSVAIVTDPPFGGRVELLAQTFQTIQEKWQKINQLSSESMISIFWIFPYFMEPHIKACLPQFTMLDYKLGYTNHPVFQTSKTNASKKKSPVRIFTNVDQSLLPLPEDEGYRFCEECKRWVAAENRHCKICQACTSKDGKTYVHCVTCRRCVKPTWVHCSVCKTCALPEHPCGKINQLRGCRKCGGETHNWRQCPQLDVSKRRRKPEHITQTSQPVEKKLRATTHWDIANV